jgi:hypothetical protein
MLHGIVLGKASWDVDVAYSKFWKPEKYGVSFSKVLARPDQLMKIKNAGGHKFLVATDLWSVKTQDVLEYARKKLGLKIFFIPREAFNYFEEFLFYDKRFLHKGKCYFNPDVVFAPGTMYEKQWSDKAKVYITGHPRFDYCLYDNWVNRRDALKKFGLNKKKKIIFFPSYTIFTSKNLDKDKSFKDWGKAFGDVFDEREMLLKTLLEFSESRNDIQVVVKLHPMSSAALKKKGITKDIEGITLKYLKNPTGNFKVIDGKKETRKVARDLLFVSNFVVGSNTTMLVEAAIVGKPVLRSMMDVSDNLIIMPGYDQIFTQSRGVNETIEKLNEMIDNNGVGFMATKLDKYMETDGKSCERICNAIKTELGVK